MKAEKFDTLLAGAIETYSELSGYTKEFIIDKLQSDETTQEIIKMMMYMAATE